MKAHLRAAQAMAGSIRSAMDACESGYAHVYLQDGGLVVELFKPRRNPGPWLTAPVGRDNWARLCQPDGPQLVVDALRGMGRRGCAGEPMKGPAKKPKSA